MTFAYSTSDEIFAVSKDVWDGREDLMARGWLERPSISNSTGTRAYPGEQASKFTASKKFFVAAAQAYLAERRVDLEWFTTPLELQGGTGIIGAFAKEAYRELDNVRPFLVLYKMSDLQFHVCQGLVAWYQPVFKAILNQGILMEISDLFPLEGVGGGVELELFPCPECLSNEVEERMEVLGINLGHLQVNLQDRINSRKAMTLRRSDLRQALGVKRRHSILALECPSRVWMQC